MRKLLGPFLCLLFGLWFLGWILFLGPVEAQLMRVAQAEVRTAIADSQHVSIEFSGQEAHLSGAVRTESEKDTVETLVKGLNPPALFGIRKPAVTRVHNDLVYGAEADAYFGKPTPYLVVVNRGKKLWLHGRVPGPGAHVNVMTAAADRYAGYELVDKIWVERSQDVAPADHLVPALRKLPGVEGHGEHGVVAIASVGQPTSEEEENHPWKVMSGRVGAPHIAEVLQPYLQKGVKPDQILEPILGKSPSLPSAYIGFTGFEERVTLYGSVPDELTRRAIESSVVAEYPEWQVVNRLEVTDRVADVNELDSLLGSVPGAENAQKDGILAFSDVSGNWKVYRGSASKEAIREGWESVFVGNESGDFRMTGLDALRAKLDDPHREKSMKLPEGSGIVDASDLENGLALSGNKLLTIAPIYFQMNDAQKSVERVRAFGEVKRALVTYPDARIDVVGHTCDRGDAGLNKRLSEKRAKQFSEFLVEQGIPAEQLNSRGMGEAAPAESNKTEAGRRKNRRVEINIIQKG